MGKKPTNNTRIQKVETFGDVRRLIIETVMDLRDGNIDTQKGMAIAANLKVLNDNIQTEINATKIKIQTENKLHQFGTVRRMGLTLISEQSPETQQIDQK